MTKDGDYLGGIRTVEHIRQRCYVNECGCWIWKMGKSHGKPSATFLDGGRMRSRDVKRQAVLMSKIEIPPGHVVTSGCDGGKVCVNPKHAKIVSVPELRKATIKALARTRMVHNGRAQRDKRLAKLTEEQVKEIIGKRDQKRTDLAKEYGVCKATIYNILGAYTWKDVTGVPANSVFSLGAAGLRLSKANAGSQQP